MAVELIQQLFSCQADADFSSKQFYAVTFDSNGLLELATAGKNMAGILQDKPISGQAGTVCHDGFTKAAITASQNLAIGALLQVDTAGTLTALSGGTAIARALQATNIAAVAVITVEILRSNAAYS